VAEASTLLETRVLEIRVVGAAGGVRPPAAASRWHAFTRTLRPVPALEFDHGPIDKNAC